MQAQTVEVIQQYILNTKAYVKTTGQSKQSKFRKGKAEAKSHRQR